MILKIDSLTKYNTLLLEQIKNQREQMKTTDATIEEIVVLERKIPSLFMFMIENLQNSVIFVSFFNFHEVIIFIRIHIN